MRPSLLLAGNLRARLRPDDADGLRWRRARRAGNGLRPLRIGLEWRVKRKHGAGGQDKKHRRERHARCKPRIAGVMENRIYDGFSMRVISYRHGYSPTTTSPAGHPAIDPTDRTMRMVSADTYMGRAPSDAPHHTNQFGRISNARSGLLVPGSTLTMRPGNDIL